MADDVAPQHEGGSEPLSAIAPSNAKPGLRGDRTNVDGWAPYALSAYHCLILIASVVITTYVIGPSSLVECQTAIPPVTRASADLLPSCSPNDPLLIAFAFCFGMLGSALTASRYVIYAVRYRNYDRNRILWQLLTPLHGGILAVVGIYVAVGGLLALAQNPSVGRQYGYFVGGFSFLVGFSSELFVKRLISATEALFGETKNIESLGEGQALKRPLTGQADASNNPRP